MAESGRYHLHQGIKVNSISYGTNGTCAPSDRMLWEQCSTTSVMFLPKLHNLNLITRKYQGHLWSPHYIVQPQILCSRSTFPSMGPCCLVVGANCSGFPNPPPLGRGCSLSRCSWVPTPLCPAIWPDAPLYISKVSHVNAWNALAFVLFSFCHHKTTWRSHCSSAWAGEPARELHEYRRKRRKGTKSHSCSTIWTLRDSCS